MYMYYGKILSVYVYSLGNVYASEMTAVQITALK